MTLRTRLAATLTLFAVLAGCGSDEEASDADSTTSTTLAAPDTSDGTDAPTSAPATPPSVSDDDFAAAIAPLKSQLAAEPDLCGILEMLNSSGNLPDPQGPAQIKEAIELTADLFTAIGSRIADEDAAAADSIRSASEALRVEAEAAGYSDEILAQNEAFNDPTFTGAMDSATSIAQARCPAQAGGSAGGTEDTGA